MEDLEIQKIPIYEMTKNSKYMSLYLVQSVKEMKEKSFKDYSDFPNYCLLQAVPNYIV